jgi:AcrR family transcriptional regulator
MLPLMVTLPPALTKEPVGAQRIPAEAHAEERRQQILALVIDVFAKRGYQGATIDHLVTGAKTSMGAFYKFFTGKEDCFVQAFDRVVEEAGERAREAVAREQGWATQVSAGLHALLDFIAEEPFSARLVLNEAQSGGPDAVRRYNEVLGEAAAALRTGRSASTAGRRLPETFEDATVSGVVWLLQARLARGEKIDVAELHQQLAKMFLTPYIGATAYQRVRARGK